MSSNSTDQTVQAPHTALLTRESHEEGVKNTSSVVANEFIETSNVMGKLEPESTNT